MASISTSAWNFSEADYSIEQLRRACLINMGGDPAVKSNYKLPVRTPDGALNRNAIHAAAAALAGARGGVDAPGPLKAKAARALLGMYRQMGDEPPESLVAMASNSAMRQMAGRGG